MILVFITMHNLLLSGQAEKLVLWRILELNGERQHGETTSLGWA